MKNSIKNYRVLLSKKIPSWARKTLVLINNLREKYQIKKGKEMPLNLDKIIESKSFFEQFKFGGISNSDEFTYMKINIPNLTGGVNEGDRKLLYVLTKIFKPKKFLEIGTHIGSSTIAIADACELDCSITSVDIRDVNCEKIKPWILFDSPMSPASMVKTIGKSVEFVQSDSSSFLENTKDNYDMIFLDGGHEALTVYKEVCLASKILTKNGIIILHDYFPNGKTLWNNNYVINGPFLALKRLKSENLGLRVYPFGDLPWQTKFGSYTTSLAVILRE